MVDINPAAFRDKLKEKKVTIVFVTTALFNQLASEAPGIFEGLKYVFFGGEAADLHLGQEWQLANLDRRFRH